MDLQSIISSDYIYIYIYIYIDIYDFKNIFPRLIILKTKGGGGGGGGGGSRYLKGFKKNKTKHL